jgi:predicted transcriptional regulator
MDTAQSCASLFSAVKSEQVLVPGLSARAAASRMAAQKASRLPVVDDMTNRRLVGLITVRHLLQPSLGYAAEEMAREKLR